jgi:multidrug efflux system outer membrane protein
MRIRNAASFLSLLLAACSTPDNESLDKMIADASQSWSGPQWWQSFNDPLLNNFAAQIFSQNLDIKIAATRLAAAKAQTTVVESRFYPDISGTGSVLRGKNQFYTKPETVKQAGLNVNWDLDIFGQIRAGVRASEAHANSLDATIDDIRNLVIANLAEAVITWRQAQETIIQTNELLRAEDEQVKLLDDRAKAGLIDASFAERAKAQRSQTATQLPQAEAVSKAAQYQIEFLLGIKDETVVEALKKARLLSIKLPSPETVSSISLDVIRNRPDVRAARFNLLAFQANLDQAEANIWPQISISSFFGIIDGTKGVRLGNNPFWTLGSSLTAPILNFGRLSGAIDAANAQSKEAAYNYEKVILLALQEVKTALSDYLNGLNTVTAQAEALKRRQETVAIAKERFNRGLTDMTDLTTAQTELDQATLALIANKTSTALAFIRFQKAVGLASQRNAREK